jgi:hypothetical protein
MSSKHQANYNKQNPFHAMERKGIVTPDTLPDVIEQGREMMARLNEQTLRPVDGLVIETERQIEATVTERYGREDDIPAAVRNVIHTALTTDRDAAYTMLSGRVKALEKDFVCENGECSICGYDCVYTEGFEHYCEAYNTALSNVHELLDTIYGKTHTV